MEDDVVGGDGWLRHAATSVRTALTSAALTLLLGLGAMSVLSSPQPPADHLGLSGDERALSRMLERHRCSTTGFGADVIPESALVRDERGHTRLVSFDDGWAVFQREQPGVLVAVCLGRLQPSKGVGRR
ncbi:hypothetical protein [Nocardioides sp. TF02-7]|uniref:hypothetical protein n=1 Tax=Nocardioides sp. TF02-7 TaxID=2917724 RepID=UPI001F05F003|nr:hypothetical protein [Nocardioides sp. TF02-7]UMG94513.1 hypothetical protein MF408_11410 [Nocardioides sp. TF02-7]